MDTYNIHRIERSKNPRDAWGIFTHERALDGLTHERQVYGPANLYDCQRERNRILSGLRHGEQV